MQDIARPGYTKQQVIDILHSDSFVMAFRYELLDYQNKYLGPLDNVLAASVANNTFADIKRTATFTMEDTEDINFLSDRIKPYARLWMPPYYEHSIIPASPGDFVFVSPFQIIQTGEGTDSQKIATEIPGAWVEWPLGVFLLSTPPRKTDSAETITREVAAYDQLQVLMDDKAEVRYTVLVGDNYIEAVADILAAAGITSVNLAPSDSILPGDRDWDPGTTKLKIINDLLGAINYRSLFFDENGVAIAQPYVSPTARASDYTYQDNSASVMFPEVSDELDLFSVPNKWTLIVSESDMAPLVSTYTNTNADSPTSTVSRGRTIMADIKTVEAADQTTLDALVLKQAFEDSQVYNQVEFDTQIMPFHSENDVLTLEYSSLEISDKYTESSWSFPLVAGGQMKHKIRKLVYI